ncbi:MAG: aldehyde dehydrogenase family protein [Eubacteriales bacterium]|nr:aldehyde dehydrogenase family protein [Eubacteriales bacterium]
MALTIDEMIVKARAAVDAIADYDQAQVDKLVYEAAKVIYKHAAELAREAVDETGLGSYEDKICKNTDTPATFWDYLKDKKSVGIIGEDKATGTIEIAHPIGVIAAITPATNPNVTPLGNFMHAMKGKNATIICPAPRAKQSSTHTVELIRDAIAKCGAPADLLQIVEEPTIPHSQELMSKADLVLATGSFGLTKAAYGSGTPAYGVGPGNPPVILDRGYDLKDCAEKSLVAVGSDNGILCDGQNLFLYPEEQERDVIDAFKSVGMVVYEDPADVAKFRDVLFLETGKPNPTLVGKDAPVIAKAAGFDIPADTKVIALKVEEVGAADPLNEEILGPVVSITGYDTFENAVQMAIDNMVESGGIGHTAGIYSNDEAHIKYYAERIPVARVLINQPTPDAWGPKTNSLSPAVSEGCGSWGNNILAGNVDYIHMINVSHAVYPLDVELPDPEKLFAD